MQRLLALLSDGHCRTIENMASELETNVSDIKRKLEYLEQIGAIRKVTAAGGQCGSCSECNKTGGHSSCSRCIPENVTENMGIKWEVIPKK